MTAILEPDCGADVCAGRRPGEERRGPRRLAAAPVVLAEGQRPPRELVGGRVVAGLGRDLAPLGEDGPKPRRRAHPRPFPRPAGARSPRQPGPPAAGPSGPR